MENCLCVCVCVCVGGGGGGWIKKGGVNFPFLIGVVWGTTRGNCKSWRPVK